MIALIPIQSSLLLLAGAVLGPRLGDRAGTQRRASYFAIAALVSSLLGLLPPGARARLTELGSFLPTEVELFGPPHLMLFAAANALLATVCVVLSPRATHSEGSFRRILLLTAVGQAFLSTRIPLLLAVLWSFSALIADWQLRESRETWDAGRLFRIYQLPSSVLFIIGAIALSLGAQWPGVVALLLAIGLREAVLPGHGWFIRFVEKAPLGVVVAFVAPQLGVYAHIELLQGVLPPPVAHFVAGVGAVSALFGAVMALGQTHVRRAVAYLVMSQTGLVAFGLENSSRVGWSGAIATWLASAVGSSALLLCVAAVSARRGPLVLGKSASHPDQVPRLGTATLISGLATVGAPLSLGFVAEDLLVQGSIAEHPFLGLALIVVTALSGITVLRIYFGLFTAGPYRPAEPDVSARELTALSLLLGLLIGGGIFPAALLQLIE